MHMHIETSLSDTVAENYLRINRLNGLAANGYNYIMLTLCRYCSIIVYTRHANPGCYYNMNHMMIIFTATIDAALRSRPISNLHKTRIDK